MSESYLNLKGLEDNTQSEASIIAKSDTVKGGESGYFQVQVEVGDYSTKSSDGSNLDANVKMQLFVSSDDQGVPESTKTEQTSENENVNVRFNHTFPKNSAIDDTVDSESNVKSNTYPRTEEPIWVNVEIEYIDRETGEEVFTTYCSTQGVSIAVKDPLTDDERAGFTELTGERLEDGDLTDTFSDRTPFAIKRIEYEDDASYISSIYVNDERNDDEEYSISFDYPNPTLAIDTAGRFAKHEIIGGSTVRQKIGEDPVNISINGVCKRRTANQIDSLRDAKSGKIFSDRLPGSNDSLRVQFGSTSTEPMEEGGAADLIDGQYLYSFQINAIEVVR